MRYAIALILLTFVGCFPYNSVKVTSLVSPDYKPRNDYHYIAEVTKKTPLTFEEEIIYAEIFNSIGNNLPGYSPASDETENSYENTAGISVSYIEDKPSEKIGSYAYPIFTVNKAKNTVQYDKNGQVSGFSHTPSDIQYAETVTGTTYKTTYPKELKLVAHVLIDENSPETRPIWQLTMRMEPKEDVDIRELLPAMITAGRQWVGKDTRGYVWEQISTNNAEYKRIKAKSVQSKPVQKEASSSN